MNFSAAANKIRVWKLTGQTGICHLLVPKMEVTT